MYNYNPKSGLFVEEVRLSEIRQEIAAQQLGDEIKNGASGSKLLFVSRWLNRARTLLAVRSPQLDSQTDMRRAEQGSVNI